MCLYTHENNIFIVFYAANDIIRRVVERLGVSTETFGFDSESVMVENLTAIESSSKRPQTCFTRGAGNYIHINFFFYVHSSFCLLIKLLLYYSTFV